LGVGEGDRGANGGRERKGREEKRREEEEMGRGVR